MPALGLIGRQPAGGHPRSPAPALRARPTRPGMAIRLRTMFCQHTLTMDSLEPKMFSQSTGPKILRPYCAMSNRNHVPPTPSSQRT